MEHSRSACVLLVAAFLALIYGESVLQLVHDFSAETRPAMLDIFSRPPTAANLRAYEDTLHEQSVAVNAVRPYLQFWRFTTMRDAGQNGMVGRDRWLFYKPGVKFLVEPWPSTNNPIRNEALRAINSFREQLRERNIELMVLIAAGKESVYPEKLGRHTDAPVNGHVLAFVHELEARGITVRYMFDLQDNQPQPGYLKQDTHWTPRLAKRWAETVAKDLLALGWAKQGTTVYQTREVTLNQHGDLLRMVKSQPLLNTTPPEKIICEQVINAQSGERYRDDPSAEILVLGDSFLRIFERDEPGSAGFIAHLARALGQPVSSIVNDGGASTLVRQELRRKPELLVGKKLVIWEFVDRDLRFGTDGWQEVTLR